MHFSQLLGLGVPLFPEPLLGWTKEMPLGSSNNRAPGNIPSAADATPDTFKPTGTPATP